MQVFLNGNVAPTHVEAKMNPIHSRRLDSLDIFRGLTIAAMIVVNNPGSGLAGARFAPLVHSDWHGCSPADLIFPFFVFITGCATAISLAKRGGRAKALLPLYRHIGRRTVTLLALGLFGSFVCGWVCQSFCPPAETHESCWRIFFRSPSDTAAYFVSLDNLRLPGVLQRLALVFFGVSVFCLHSGWRLQALAVAGLLSLYWGLQSLPGFSLEPGADVGAWLDRHLFGADHLYRESWDPEGLLGTLPAMASGLLGALAGQWVGSGLPDRVKLTGLMGFGCLAGLGGWLWGLVLPLNKSLWTSSFALYSAGWAMILLGVLFWLFDCRRARPASAQPVLWLGRKTLLVYCLSQLLALALDQVYLGQPSQHTSLLGALRTCVLGESWDVAGLSLWADPRWPSLYWSLLCLSAMTALIGLTTWSRTLLASLKRAQPLSFPGLNLRNV
jgi:predicted acyltransferase